MPQLYKHKQNKSHKYQPVKASRPSSYCSLLYVFVLCGNVAGLAVERESVAAAATRSLAQGQREQRGLQSLRP